jgi:cytochrome c
MNRIGSRVLAAVLTAALFGPAVHAQDGQTAFNNACRTCHSLKAGDNRLGPTLYGIIDRKAGAIDGFPYSDSLKQSGITWNELNLDAFIANPDALIRGHRMRPYGGIADADQRKAIIEWLKQAR